MVCTDVIPRNEVTNKVLPLSMTGMQVKELGVSVTLTEPANTRAQPINSSIQGS